MAMTSAGRETAKIYQFPVSPRLQPAQQHGAAKLAQPDARTAPVSSGWYHEAALQEADRARKP
jgi:hypothetical protein